MLQTYWPIALGVLVVVALLVIFFRSEAALNRQAEDRSEAHDAAVKAPRAAGAADPGSSLDRNLRA